MPTPRKAGMRGKGPPAFTSMAEVNLLWWMGGPNTLHSPATRIPLLDAVDRDSQGSKSGSYPIEAHRAFYMFLTVASG